MSGLINKILHHGHGNKAGSDEAQYNVGSTEGGARDSTISYDSSTSATPDSAPSGTSVGKFAAALTAFATGDKSTTVETTGTSGLTSQDTPSTTDRSAEYETTTAPVMQTTAAPVAETTATTGLASELDSTATTGAGSYDPYAKETTTGPTGFATGYAGDTGRSGEYGDISAADRGIGGAEYETTTAGTTSGIGGADYGTTSGTTGTTGVFSTVTGGSTSSAAVTGAGYGASDIHVGQFEGEILPGPAGVKGAVNENDPNFVAILEDVKQHGVDDHGL